MIDIRAFILHINISCDKIFLLHVVSRYLSLWPRPFLELAFIGAYVFHKHILLKVKIVISEFISNTAFVFL